MRIYAILGLLSYVAQTERENIRKRQAEGIAAAKARGVRFGRPGAVLPKDFDKLVKQWENGLLPLRALLARCGVCRTTFFKYLAIFRALQGPDSP